MGKTTSIRSIYRRSEFERVAVSALSCFRRCWLLLDLITMIQPGIMTMKHRFTFLYSILTTCISLYACGSDGSDSGDDGNTGDEPICERSSCQDDDILVECNGGVPKSIPCKSQGKICDLARAQCVDPNPPDTQEPQDPKTCEQNSCKDKTTLIECNNGSPNEISCSKLFDESGLPKVCQGGECVVDTAARPRPVPLPPACEQNSCKNENTLIECNNGTPTEIACDEIVDDNGKPKICHNGACISTQCTKDVCRDSETLLECNKNDEIAEYGTYIVKNCADVKAGFVCDTVQHECAEPECKEDICNDQIVLRCIDYKLVRDADCAEQNMICNKGETVECIKPPDTCDRENVTYCDGNTLIHCSKDKSKTTTNCEKNDMICDPIGRKCTYECDESSTDICLNASTLKTCVDHHWVEAICGESNPICLNGACTEDPCTKCGEGETCINSECIPNAVSVETDIGMPCQCYGGDCNTIITNRELKSYFTVAGLLIANQFMAELKDEDYAVVPNFFSKNIVGCESLAESAPEGMVVGCMRTSTISISPSQADFLVNKVPGLLKMVGKSSQLLLNVIPKIAPKLQEGIAISAPNGYCIYGAVDISGAITHKMIRMAILDTAFDRKKGFFKNVNVGDHAVVAAAAQKAEDTLQTYCPKGSELMSYVKTRVSPSIGSGSIAVDLCLKSCEKDEDCRNGYKCINLPDGLPPSGLDMTHQSHKKVCFDEENIAMLKALRSDLTQQSNT